MFVAPWLRRGGRTIRSDCRRAVTLLFGTLFTLAVCTRIEGLGNRRAAAVTASDVFAQSALDTLVGDLQTEIAQGSTATTTDGGTIYQPLSPLYMLPARSGNPAPSGSPAVDPIPNLIRRSVRADAITTPGVSSLASAINSSADASLNGSAVNAARWNLHYLIPRFDAGSTADSTPDAAAQFTTPDWVLVTRNGPSVLTGIGTGSTALNNPDPVNTNYVVGRYAFAMYDEGGLLDVNAAGYPTPTTPASPTGFTATQVGWKGSAALADLTQLPVVKTPASASDYVPQASIDQLVGWRNYASAQPSGTFPNYTFDAAAAARYYKAAQTNRTGFLSVDPTVQFNGTTDQLFTSRQQLIGLCDAFGLSRNALQYLTTFSRALEQPSFVPAHVQYPANSSTGLQEAPNINAVSSSTPPPANNADSYLGNNDAAGTTGSVSNQDLANPAFLTVRVPVTVAGGRNDGSDLVQGEPLVKKRFSLRRLSWVTYKGPSANNLTDPNVQQAITAMGGDPSNANDPVYQLVAQGTAANIQKYFGLTWGPDPTWGGYVWMYNHGANSILTLAQVAAAGREADFAELLKASINVGSLAKGGPNLNYFAGQVLNYQYTVDTTVDYNVLQLMANLIDQFDTDSYPTVIELAVAGSQPRAFRGVEDLPYLYRYHPFSVVKTLPVPLLSRSNSVTFTSGGTALTTVSNTIPATGVNLSNPGEAELLWAADVWNPHDTSSTDGTVGSRPAAFRLSAITGDPISATTPWQVGAAGHVVGERTGTIPSSASTPVIPYTTLADTTSSFTFSDASGHLFREPTLLWRTDAPTGANITPETGSLAGPYVDVNTGVPYCGVWHGKTPLAFVGAVAGYTGSPADSHGNYLFEEAGQLTEMDQVPSGSYRQFTFRLSYQDPTSGHWVIYDENYPDTHGLLAPNIVLNKSDYSNQQYLNSWSIGQIQDDVTSYDPRNARFGMATEGILTASGLALLESSVAPYYQTNSSAANAKTGLSKFTVLTTNRPVADRGNQANYCGPCMTSDPGHMLSMRWYSGQSFNASATATGAANWPLWYSGMISQNNPAALVPPRSSPTGNAILPIYYEDADGIGRRAMGAYAALPQSYTPNPLTVTTTPIAGLEGLPEATANQFSTSSYGVGTATYQSQSRPLILNRPFHSVAEMSYASRGGIWKQVDFFTPESGDTGLLDCFCIDDPLPTALAAGKVNLNTRQQPVLKAILSGAYRDEVNNYSSSALPYSPSAPLMTTEADAAASKVLSITTDTTDNWRGPFSFIGDIVGRYIPNPNGTGTDLYTYQATAPTGVPSPNPAYSFAGLSAALDNTVYTYVNSTPGSNPTSAPDYKIQRMRETAIRPLADCGQTRVWNILIDLVAQTGNYPANATMLSQFQVTQENHYWLDVALDRFTGQVLDENLEQIFEGATDLALNTASVSEDAAVGTAVGSILPTDANANDTFTYSLVSGTGSDDNASFTLAGNTLQTATTFRYLTQSSYTVRVAAVNGYGQSFAKALSISILPDPYTQWKITNFGNSASIAAIAGDGADPDHDGLINLLEYALGTSPVLGGSDGVTVSRSNGTLTMDYPRSSAATDASLHAFWTTDLTNPNGWTRTGVTETLLSDDGTTQQWQATVSVSPGQPAFMRLRATRP